MASRFHRLLLRWYPPEFRARFGGELLFALERGSADAWRRGVRRGLTFLTLSTLDAVINGLRERRRLSGATASAIGPPHAARRGGLMPALTTDLKYAVRLLTRNPGFAGLAIATLSLGIGLTTAIFSVAYDALRRPLPYADEGRVVMLWEFAPAKDAAKSVGTPANFLDWRARNRTFSYMGALAPFSATVVAGGDAVRIEGRRATSDIFRALGMDPLLGRVIQPEDEVQGNQVVLLSHRVWHQQFGGNPSILGASILVNESPRRVIGVLKPEFRLVRGEDGLFIPLVFSGWERQARKSHWISVVARLKDGATLEQAQADMRVVADGLATEYPDANAGESVLVEPIRESLVGDLRPALLMLSGAVTLVLLIACVNVANLLLVRATGRQQEFAVRRALGAERVRLLRQLFAESVVLAVLAGSIGLVLAYWTVAGLRQVLPDTLLRVGEIDLNPAIALGAVALSALTGILFGLAPVLQLWTDKAMTGMREGRSTPSRSTARFRQVLVTAQIALALVLLVGAGLLMRSFVRLVGTDPGFRPDHLLTLRIELPRARYGGPKEWKPFFDRVIAELGSIPGVSRAAGISWLPLASDGGSNAIFVEGRPLPGPNENTYAIYRLVTPGYFQTIGIPILEGRDFTGDDRIDGLRVGAINRTLATRLWPGESAIGKRLTFARAPKPEDWIHIVAIVGDTHHANLAEPIDIELYSPFTQDPYWFPPSDLVIRTSASPAAIANTARERLRAIDPLIPVSDVQTMESLIGKTVAEPRFQMLLMGALGLSALALATVGIYGLLAFSVALRSREIGVRTALGATPRTIAGMVLGEGMRLAALGVAAGLTGAFLAARSLRTLLFEIEPSDPITFAGIGCLLLLVAALACYVPARRATRVDPVTALRE